MHYLFGDYCLDTQRYELRRGNVPIPLRPFHIHDHVLPWQTDLHRDIEHLALVVMTMRCINDDATRLYAVAEHVQMIGETADTRLDRRGSLDVPERDLDRCCHCCRSSVGLARGDAPGSEPDSPFLGASPQRLACSTQGYTRGRHIGHECVAATYETLTGRERRDSTVVVVGADR